MGLRIAGAENPSGVPLTANVMADSGIPALLPTFGAPATDPSLSGTGPRFTNASRGLAGTGSTNSGTQFFLGQQNSALLLNRIFGRG